MQVNRKNFASRNRKRQSEYRRQQIIEATIDCIDALGLSRTTLASIAKKAGLSQGNVIFHFRSKDEVLEQTLLHLRDEYMSYWTSELSGAGPAPEAKIRAMVRASFAPHICNRKKISVWMAFWGESRSRPKYMRVCGASDGLVSETLLALCQAVEDRYGARVSARTAALSLECTIDGLWQNFLINSPVISRAEAINTVLELFGSFYPELGRSED